MPLYNIPQAGPWGPPNQGRNVTELCPGDFMVLFDGAVDTPAAGDASVAFARGPGRTDGDNGTTFSITFPSAPTAQVDIQGTNDLSTAATWTTVYSSLNTQNDPYTDVGRFRFYRAKLTSYSAGGAPTVIASR